MLLAGVMMMRWSAHKSMEDVRNVEYLQTEIVQLYESAASSMYMEGMEKEDWTTSLIHHNVHMKELRGKNILERCKLQNKNNIPKYSCVFYVDIHFILFKN